METPQTEPKLQIEDSKKIFSGKDLWKLIYPIIIEQLLAHLVGIAYTLTNLQGILWYYTNRIYLLV